MLSTKTKIGIARVLNRVIVGSRTALGYDHVIEVRRRGIKWRLDLNEGIDLALYLGVYQEIPKRVADRWMPSGSLVIDIGANIGAHSLPMARRVGDKGRVIAVEPTDYAFAHLSENIALNSGMAERFVPVQAALIDDSTAAKPSKYYSRWPLRGDARERHERHLGQFEPAAHARALSLDALLEELRIGGRVNGPVSFVKLDVDGHELEVLRGGRRLFAQEQPAALIELAPHVQDEVSGRFEALIALLGEFGYVLEDADHGKPLPMSAAELRRIVGKWASLDVVAQPT